MLKSSLLISFLNLGIFTSHAFAEAFEGAPTGTVELPCQEVSRGADFVGGVLGGMREQSSGREYLLSFRVRGFSLSFEAGTEEITTTAIETSYYSPEWQRIVGSGDPTFVWWESDETTSVHIMKIPAARRDAEVVRLRVDYLNENRQRSVLVMECSV